MGEKVFSFYKNGYNHRLTLCVNVEDNIKKVYFIMTRVKRGECARQRRKKLLKLNRSFSGVHSRLFRQAKQQRFKALRSSFVNRKKFKRESRRLWIQRIQ